LVMDDPDLHAIDETETIGVFEPGRFIEREVDWSRLMNVSFITLGSYLLSVVFTMIILIPLLAVGLVDIFAPTLDQMFKPWSMIILTTASFAFLFGPVYYVRKNGLSYKSIGIRDMRSLRNAVFGVGVGLLMFGGNIVFSWLISDVMNVPVQDDPTLMASDIYELIGWVIVMFVVVGFTEEVLFRGFLQRRMEMYFRGRGNGTNAPLKAILITSFIFAAIHLDIIGLATRFMLGMFLGYLAQRTNYSILGPAIAHGLNNAIIVVLLFI
jgi:membrane protease YdiL (CAAX protease family)